MSRRFTHVDRSGLRRLKTGEKLSEHGITVERLADGDLRFSINVMIDNQRVHRTIGRESDGVTRRACESIIEKMKTEARSARFGLPVPDKRVAPTLAKAATDYLGRMAESGGRNLDKKRLHLHRHLVPFLGAAQLGAITAFTIERYKRDRLAAGAAKATVNRELSSLGHLFTKALEWGWIDRIPVRLQKFREENGRITVLNDGEIDRLLQAAIAGPDPDLWLFIEICRSTGMRHYEVVRIRWEHCDLDNRRIFIPKAKAGARSQPVPPRLADILRRERAMRVEGYIFPARHSRSTKGHIESFEHQFRRAVIDAGLDPKVVTPHVLRHSVITRLVQSGIDLITIMQISGHKTLRMVQRYAHVSAPHIDAAVAVLDRDYTGITQATRDRR